MQNDDRPWVNAYEANCPKCGRLMVERWELAPRRDDGTVVLWCSEHGPYHFAPTKDLTEGMP